MGKLLQVFQHQNWVRAGEHVALRVGSLLFSMVSAHAILWFYDSLAMVDMDLEKAKYSSLRPAVGGYRPVAAPAIAPRSAAVPNRSLPQPQAQPKLGMNGNTAQAPASSGWKFPFRKSSVNGVAENGANGAVPIVVE